MFLSRRIFLSKKDKDHFYNPDLKSIDFLEYFKKYAQQIMEDHKKGGSKEISLQAGVIHYFNDLTKNKKAFSQISQFFIHHISSYLIDGLIVQPVIKSHDLERILHFPVLHSASFQKANIFYNCCMEKIFSYETMNIVELLFSNGLSSAAILNLIIKTAEYGKAAEEMMTKLWDEKSNVLYVIQTIKNVHKREEFHALQKLLSEKLPEQIKDEIETQLEAKNILEYLDNNSLFHSKRPGDNEFLWAKEPDDQVSESKPMIAL